MSTVDDGPVATAIITPTSTTTTTTTQPAPSPTVMSSTSPPITPTPSSMSFMFYQRRHPDATNVALEPEGSQEDKDDRRPETTIIIPDSSTLASTPLSPNPNPISSSVTPTTSRPSSTSIDPTLFSNRPAPPSPALSRRVSGAPSISSSNRPRSRSSRPSSLAISRANSGRIHPSTTTIVLSDPIPTAAVSSTPSPAPVYIKVRDYAFTPTDDRHVGLGTDTPKPNRVHRLNRKLGGPDRARARVIAAIAASSSTTGTGRPVRGSIGSVGSVDSSDVDVEEEEEEEEDEGWGNGIGGWGKRGGGDGLGWDGFKMGMGRFSWSIGSSHSNIRTFDQNDKDSTTSNGIFPSRKDLDMNFMDSSSSSDDNDDDDARQQQQQPITEDFSIDDDDDDDFDQTGLQQQQQRPNWNEDADEYADTEDGEEEEEEEPLYPGLYRALYAFEPEGTAEMKLDEDQIVRVVGRGGGVGWAVVVVDDHEQRAGSGPLLKHALVPEGYLEAVRLDWEDEEFAEDDDQDADGRGDLLKLDAVQSGNA